ncbi:hypothetical protein pb186bvf_011312 [Paramecium bursaria]
MMHNMNSSMDQIHESKIEMPSMRSQPQPQQQHQHTEQCRHHNHSMFRNPFSNMPSEMRVFIWYQIVSGDLFFSIFMQLPMMGQFYAMYSQAKGLIVSPFFMISNTLHQFLQSNNMITKFITGLGIYYFLFHLILYKLVGESFQEKDLIFATQISIIILFNLVVIIPPGYYEKSQFKEILEKTPEIMIINKKSRNICLMCDIPRVCRSHHCIYCKRCIKRQETHSLLFNTCVGAYNFPFYILTMIIITFYFLLILRQFYLPRNVEKSIFDLISIIIYFHQFQFFGQNLLQILTRVSFNITTSEIYQWKRYPYMWKNEKGHFQNPFDKGLIKNWISIFKPLYSKSGNDNWGSLIILNPADIEGHPLSQQVYEQIQGMIQQVRQVERQLMKDSSINHVDTEKQGLLE